MKKELDIFDILDGKKNIEIDCSEIDLISNEAIAESYVELKCNIVGIVIDNDTIMQANDFTVQLGSLIKNITAEMKSAVSDLESKITEIKRPYLNLLDETKKLDVMLGENLKKYHIERQRLDEIRQKEQRNQEL